MRLSRWKERTFERKPEEIIKGPFSQDSICIFDPRYYLGGHPGSDIHDFPGGLGALVISSGTEYRDESEVRKLCLDGKVG